MNGETANRPIQRREKIPAAHLWFLGGFGGALIALFVLGLQWKDSRRVERVEVSGGLYVGERDLLARAAVPDGALIDTVALGPIRDRLLSHPYVRDARVSRAYPDAVAIEVEERIPVASFTLNGAIRYLDADGVVLPFLRSEMSYDLPGITGIPALGRTRVGEAVGGTEFGEALAILDAALATDSSVYRLISEVDMKQGGDVCLYSTENAVPIWFGRGDEIRKFVLLRGFWEKYAREGGPQNLEYLDLRFTDQVVAKWQNKPQSPVNLSSREEGEG